MRHIIYGAGAIGGSIGARLHLAGKQVVLIARGDHYNELRTRGLRYRNPESDVRLEIPVVDHPRKIEFAEDDVVFFTMKSQHTHGALLDLRDNTDPRTPIVCCQNGVSNEPAALRWFTNVYGMVVMLPATHLEPGEILHYATVPGGFLDCGRFPGGIDDVIASVAADLTDAGFTARPDERAMRWKYAKLLQNLGNSLQALCERDYGDLMSRATQEALAVYDAAGVDCATRDETREQFKGGSSGAIAGVERGGGSSWQSLARGTGDIETDYLNGEICYLGRLHGIPTPVNETLTVLAARAIRTGVSPGSMTAEQIQTEVMNRS
jgi:2-dehydropantoate 2-reductase